MIARAAAVALAVLALAAAAGAAPVADPGVTSTTVLLGGTVPLTGEAAAFGTVGSGARAYFDYVNARGGVHGRKIEYRYYDDAYNPAQSSRRRAGSSSRTGFLHSSTPSERRTTSPCATT